MTPEQFAKQIAERLSASPKGLPVDEYLDLMVTLLQEAVTEAYGIRAHVTLFVGTRIEEVKVRTTLKDEHLLSLLKAFSEHMALKYTPTPHKAS
jgi:hypothetical protein